jgi:hypothetical protein
VRIEMRRMILPYKESLSLASIIRASPRPTQRGGYARGDGPDGEQSAADAEV